MNMPITRTQREVYERVLAIDLPISACRKRWPDFRFEEIVDRWPAYAKSSNAGKPRAFYVRAKWTDEAGVERGLAHDLGTPEPSGRAIDEAKELLARQALYNAEYRKATT